MKMNFNNKSRSKKIILVGNPNVGKSVIFNYLTGKYATVSNYPGTTVEISRGILDASREKIEVLDSPGVNSLFPTSEDEMVTRNILLDEEKKTIIIVGDAKNVLRAVSLTIQLSFFDYPLILILNMMDEAGERGIEIDIPALSNILGIEIYPSIATKGKGLRPIKTLSFSPEIPSQLLNLPEDMREEYTRILDILPSQIPHRRYIALCLLAGDRSIMKILKDKFQLPVHVEEEIFQFLRRRNSQFFLNSLTYLISRTAGEVASRVLKKKELPSGGKNIRDFLGRAMMGPVSGIPFAIFVLLGMYYFVGVLGAGITVDFLESTIFAKYISPFFISLFDKILPFSHEHMKDGITLLPEYSLSSSSFSLFEEICMSIHDFFVGPYGIITMAFSYAIAIIFPIVTFFFICFGILEDSGYMPRLAVMADRIFKIMGLNGKAVLPIILGLGCDTMATITTRILETRKEKIIATLLLALAIPCSAQLGVILGMLGKLPFSATFIWAGVVVGVMFFVGYLSSIFIQGRRESFIMELPPVRLPSFKNIFAKTLFRLEWYMKEAVPLFLLGTMVLFAFDKTGIMERIYAFSAPVVKNLLGLPEKTAEAFILGFLRRDYGAAGLYDMQARGMLDNVQVLVSIVTITLFIPCVANFLVIIKERGVKVAAGIFFFVIFFSLLAGSILNHVLRSIGYGG